MRQRLADFIFSEDVEVADVGEPLTHLGLYGPLAAATLAPVLGSREGSSRVRQRYAGRLSPSGSQTCAVSANIVWSFGGSRLVVVASDDYGVRGFELFVDGSRRDALIAALARAGRDAIVAGRPRTSRASKAGRPEFGADMDEHTIPLEAGIEDRAISLTKGCYVGQEVIIRVLHRGQGRVARRLVGFVGAPRRVRGSKARAAARRRRGEAVWARSRAPSVPHACAGRLASGYVHRDSCGAGHACSVAAARDAAPRGHVTVVTLALHPASSLISSSSAGGKSSVAQLHAGDPADLLTEQRPRLGRRVAAKEMQLDGALGIFVGHADEQLLADA